MGKPSSHTTQTITQDNTPWNSQYLADQFGLAKDLYNNNPVNYYPDQSLYIDPALRQGYGRLFQAAQGVDTNLRPIGNRLFGEAASGGMSSTESPAYATLMGIGGGTSKPQEWLSGLSRNLVNAGNLATQNPSLKYLTASARGDYLNANPYLDKMYGAASDAVTRQYQTATAPQTDSAFERSGRYGSGAMMNARSQNEQNLGSILDNLASNIYGTNYGNERQLMTQAAGALGTQYLGGIGARTEAMRGAGSLQNADLAARGQASSSLQSGFDTGNQNALRALGLFPSIVDANLTPAKVMVDGGTGLTGLGQSEIQDAMNRFYGNEMAPWQNLQRYSQLLGNPINGTQTTTQPLYSNPLASILGTGLAGASILGQTGAFGGSGWLTGGGGLLGGLFGGAEAPAALSAALAPSTAASLGFGGLSAIGLPLLL